MTSLSKTFTSNGKLLITGEYVVLDGAKALAIPCSFGQKIDYTPSEENHLIWESKTLDNSIWMNGVYSYSEKSFREVENNNSKIEKLISTAFRISKKEIIGKVVSTLEFPIEWGLGSSSTLVANIAHLFNIDPLELFFEVENGSGYDVACASAKTPIFYSIDNGNVITESIDFDPLFKGSVFFIHLNQKQKSDREVESYNQLKRKKDIASYIQEITTLSERLQKTVDLPTFENILTRHETILSSILQRETIKNSLFRDYNGGIVKSLGAWGGEFVLVTGKEEDLSYFEQKGYDTILSFEEMKYRSNE